MNNLNEQIEKLEEENSNLKTDMQKLSDMYETGMSMLISTNQIIQTMTQRQNDCYSNMVGRNNKVLKLVYILLVLVFMIIATILFLHLYH